MLRLRGEGLELKEVRGCPCRCKGVGPELKEVRGCRCRCNWEGPELKVKLWWCGCGRRH